MLEEGSFRGRSADFIMMFLFGGVLMTVSFEIMCNKITFTFLAYPNYVFFLVSLAKRISSLTKINRSLRFLLACSFLDKRSR